MYLKKIKISGFKSFVDATTLHFPHDMTAVVGPNGCGKSNIIDAVRWVLGESSAKHLRGDAMADVIFNGSTGRAPVSRASVELLFDNSEKRVEHSLAPYNEIAIRREYFRDGTNQYYLNGKKCRRKDVTELFLGTGLGPRSYAIIEQGMISRLIESKPHELRNFIEEAAGISKYKEKRRETELRIKQTRDNLARLSDIRIELGNQLEKLQAQSLVAKQFRDLKRQQRESKAKLALVQIYDVERLGAQFEKQQGLIKTEEFRLAAQRTKISTAIDDIILQHNDLHMQLDDLQNSFYQQGTELSKLEQNIVHQQSRKQESSSKQDQFKQQQTQLDKLLQTEQQQLSQLQSSAQLDQQGLTSAQAELATLETNLSKLNKQSEALLQQQASSLKVQQTQQAQHNQLTGKAEHAQQLLAKTQSQHQQLLTEIAQLAEQDNSVNISDKIQLRQQLEASIHEHKQQAQAQSQLKQKLEQDIQFATQGVADKSQTLQALSANLQITQGLLQSGHADDTTQHWLETHLSRKPQQLLDLLQVESGWEMAVEKVLSHWLDAYALNETEIQQFDLARLPGLQWFTERPQVAIANTLAAKVQSHTFNQVLNQVICVESRQEAMAALVDAPQNHSFITANGDWFTTDGVWLSEQSADKTVKSRILLQQEAEAATANIARLEPELALDKQQLAELKIQLEVLSDVIATDKQAEHKLNTEYSNLVLEIKLLQQQQTAWQENYHKLEQRNGELQALLTQEQRQIAEVTQAISTLNLAMQANNVDEQLTERIALAEQDIQQLTLQKEELRQTIQALTVNKAKYTVEIEKQQELIVKTQAQKQQLQTDIQRLQLDGGAELLLQQLQRQRDDLVKQKIATETLQIKLKGQSSKLQQSKQELQIKHDKLNRDIGKSKDKAQQLALKQANNKAKEQLLYQQVADDNVDIVALKRECGNILTTKEYQQILTKIDEQLHAIGAVNLAAVEEYEQQSQRKQYLDEQTDDLERAIETLEAAIVKIDKQTRSRFSTTFEKINTDFKSLFPKVFGGGAAWLELTSSNILDAGVTIMARPPGKKNARISLLSGGEKALTALSLVFAIFRLNPAPFCMLDEVDAPLDELNVTRFCKLVQEMSSTVQFIYISHNKLAMEMAEQLIGVTMHEPGVSRIVAVDIAAAMEFTDN